MQVATTIDGDNGMVVKRLSVPIGLEELMESLTKEVLLRNPADIYTFASEHFAHLLCMRNKKLLDSNHDKSNKKMFNKKEQHSIQVKSATVATKFNKLPTPIIFTDSKSMPHAIPKKTSTYKKIPKYNDLNISPRSIGSTTRSTSSETSQSNDNPKQVKTGRARWKKQEVSKGLVKQVDNKINVLSNIKQKQNSPRKRVIKSTDVRSGYKHEELIKNETNQKVVIKKTQKNKSKNAGVIKTNTTDSSKTILLSTDKNIKINGSSVKLSDKQTKINEKALVVAAASVPIISTIVTKSILSDNDNINREHNEDSTSYIEYQSSVRDDSSVGEITDSMLNTYEELTKKLDTITKETEIHASKENEEENIADELINNKSKDVKNIIEDEQNSEQFNHENKNDDDNKLLEFEVLENKGGTVIENENVILVTKENSSESETEIHVSKETNEEKIVDELKDAENIIEVQNLGKFDHENKNDDENRLLECEILENRGVTVIENENTIDVTDNQNIAAESLLKSENGMNEHLKTIDTIITKENSSESETKIHASKETVEEKIVDELKNNEIKDVENIIEVQQNLGKFDHGNKNDDNKLLEFEVLDNTGGTVIENENVIHVTKENITESETEIHASKETSEKKIVNELKDVENIIKVEQNLGKFDHENKNDDENKLLECEILENTGVTVIENENIIDVTDNQNITAESLLKFENGNNEHLKTIDSISTKENSSQSETEIHASKETDEEKIVDKLKNNEIKDVGNIIEVQQNLGKFDHGNKNDDNKLLEFEVLDNTGGTVIENENVIFVTKENSTESETEIHASKETNDEKIVNELKDIENIIEVEQNLGKFDHQNKNDENKLLKCEILENTGVTVIENENIIDVTDNQNIAAESLLKSENGNNEHLKTMNERTVIPKENSFKNEIEIEDSKENKEKDIVDELKNNETKNIENIIEVEQNLEKFDHENKNDDENKLLEHGILENTTLTVIKNENVIDDTDNQNIVVETSLKFENGNNEHLKTIDEHTVIPKENSFENEIEEKYIVVDLKNNEIKNIENIIKVEQNLETFDHENRNDENKLLECEVLKNTSLTVIENENVNDVTDNQNIAVKTSLKFKNDNNKHLKTIDELIDTIITKEDSSKSETEIQVIKETEENIVDELKNNETKNVENIIEVEQNLENFEHENKNDNENKLLEREILENTSLTVDKNENVMDVADNQNFAAENLLKFENGNNEHLKTIDEHINTVITNKNNSESETEKDAGKESKEENIVDELKNNEIKDVENIVEVNPNLENIDYENKNDDENKLLDCEILENTGLLSLTENKNVIDIADNQKNADERENCTGSKIETHASKENEEKNFVGDIKNNEIKDVEYIIEEKPILGKFDHENKNYDKNKLHKFEILEHTGLAVIENENVIDVTDNQNIADESLLKIKNGNYEHMKTFEDEHINAVITKQNSFEIETKLHDSKENEEINNEIKDVENHGNKNDDENTKLLEYEILENKGLTVIDYENIIDDIYNQNNDESNVVKHENDDTNKVLAEEIKKKEYENINNNKESTLNDVDNEVLSTVNIDASLNESFNNRILSAEINSLMEHKNTEINSNEGVEDGQIENIDLDKKVEVENDKFEDFDVATANEEISDIHSGDTTIGSGNKKNVTESHKNNATASDSNLVLEVDNAVNTIMDTDNIVHNDINSVSNKDNNEITRSTETNTTDTNKYNNLNVDNNNEEIVTSGGSIENKDSGKKLNDINSGTFKSREEDGDIPSSKDIEHNITNSDITVNEMGNNVDRLTNSTPETSYTANKMDNNNENVTVDHFDINKDIDIITVRSYDDNIYPSSDMLLQKYAQEINSIKNNVQLKKRENDICENEKIINGSDELENINHTDSIDAGIPSNIPQLLQLITNGKNEIVDVIAEPNEFDKKSVDTDKNLAKNIDCVLVDSSINMENTDTNQLSNSFQSIASNETDSNKNNDHETVDGTNNMEIKEIKHVEDTSKSILKKNEMEKAIEENQPESKDYKLDDSFNDIENKKTEQPGNKMTKLIAEEVNKFEKANIAKNQTVDNDHYELVDNSNDIENKEIENPIDAPLLILPTKNNTNDIENVEGKLEFENLSIQTDQNQTENTNHELVDSSNNIDNIKTNHPGDASKLMPSTKNNKNEIVKIIKGVNEFEINENQSEINDHKLVDSSNGTENIETEHPNETLQLILPIKNDKDEMVKAVAEGNNLKNSNVETDKNQSENNNYGLILDKNQIKSDDHPLIDSRYDNEIIPQLIKTTKKENNKTDIALPETGSISLIAKTKNFIDYEVTNYTKHDENIDLSMHNNTVENEIVTDITPQLNKITENKTLEENNLKNLEEEIIYKIDDANEDEESKLSNKSASTNSNETRENNIDEDSENKQQLQDYNRIKRSLNILESDMIENSLENENSEKVDNKDSLNKIKSVEIIILDPDNNVYKNDDITLPLKSNIDDEGPLHLEDVSKYLINKMEGKTVNEDELTDVLQNQVIAVDNKNINDEDNTDVNIKKSQDCFGHLVNLNVSAPNKEVLSNNPRYQENAAIKIQSLWRGYKTRNAHTENQISTTNESVQNSAQDNNNNIKAATLIQSFVRGHLVRKQFKIAKPSTPKLENVIEENDEMFHDNSMLIAVGVVDRSNLDNVTGLQQEIVNPNYENQDQLETADNINIEKMQNLTSTNNKEKMENDINSRKIMNEDTTETNQNDKNNDDFEGMESDDETENSENESINIINQIKNDLHNMQNIIVNEINEENENDDFVIQNLNNNNNYDNGNIKILANIIGAATKIQSLFRGYRVRNQNIKTENSFVLDNAKENLKQDQMEKAATKIQSLYRGYCVRNKNTLTDKNNMIQKFDDQRKHDAATKIQSLFRSYKAQKEQLKEKSSVINVDNVANNDKSCIIKEEMNQTPTDIEAALKIQKAFRNYILTKKPTEQMQKEVNMSSASVKNDQTIITNKVDCDNLIMAAITIQRCFKKYLNKKKAKDTNQTSDESIINTNIDNNIAINVGGNLLKGNEEENITSYSYMNAALAAIKIQRFFKQFIEKKKTKKTEYVNELTRSNLNQIDELKTNNDMNKLKIKSEEIEQSIKSSIEDLENLSQEIDNGIREPFYLHDPNKNIDNPIANTIRVSSRGSNQKGNIGLLHSGEFHDSVNYTPNIQMLVQDQSSSPTSLTTSPVLLHSGELHDADGLMHQVQHASRESLAGDASVTLGRETVAHASVNNSTARFSSEIPFGSAESVQDMDEKRNNATIIERNMESDAATKIQASFRGYQVRKQLNTKNTTTVSSRRSSRRKNSKSNENRKVEPVDIEERSATKIQAGVRGFLVRRRQKQKPDSH